MKLQHPNLFIMTVLPIITDDEWDVGSDYISKSRLSLYKFCPIKYKKQYIDKVLPRDGSHASTVGTRFHEFAELFMQVAKQHDPEKWMSFIHPEFSDEEVPQLTFFINRELQRLRDPETYQWEPIALEYRVVDNNGKIRGIIDRIDLIGEKFIEVIEYKTSQKISKPTLQFEFGFYDMLLDSVKELAGYKRRYIVINPRLEQVVSFTPSRRSTIERKLNNINYVIANDKFVPTCKGDYATAFCSICTLEEIALYNGFSNIRSE